MPPVTEPFWEAEYRASREARLAPEVRARFLD